MDLGTTKVKRHVFKNCVWYKFSTKRNTRNEIIVYNDGPTVVRQIMLIDKHCREHKESELYVARKFKDKLLVRRHISLTQDSLYALTYLLFNIQTQPTNEQDSKTID